MIKIGFELEMDEGVEAPSSVQLVQALAEALPKEWWADHREGSWGVKALFALNDDGTLQQADVRLRPESVAHLHKKVEIVVAQLAQEKKLTAHLDEQLENQAELLRVKGDDISAYVATVARLDKEVVDKEEQVANLVTKNDNQVEIIKRMQSKTKAWTVQDNDSTDTIRRMRGVNRDLVIERDGLMEQVKADTETLTRLSRDLEGCRASNRTHLGEAKVGEEMVEKIVDAMQGAGYDISGWGNDAELDELETASQQIEDQVQAAQKEIRLLNLDLATVADRAVDVESSIDDASSEQDGLDSLLDTIRTRR